MRPKGRRSGVVVDGGRPSAVVFLSGGVKSGRRGLSDASAEGVGPRTSTAARPAIGDRAAAAGHTTIFFFYPRGGGGGGPLCAQLAGPVKLQVGQQRKVEACPRMIRTASRMIATGIMSDDRGIEHGATSSSSRAAPGSHCGPGIRRDCCSSTRARSVQLPTFSTRTRLVKLLGHCSRASSARRDHASHPG